MNGAERHTRPWAPIFTPAPWANAHGRVPAGGCGGGRQPSLASTASGPVVKVSGKAHSTVRGIVLVRVYLVNGAAGATQGSFPASPEALAPGPKKMCCHGSSRVGRHLRRPTGPSRPHRHRSRPRGLLRPAKVTVGQRRRLSSPATLRFRRPGAPGNESAGPDA